MDGINDERIRPRIVDTAEYVKKRVEQIAELLDVLDKSGPNIGNDPSAARTAFQRLPRHMRRRAMSYNIKRLPRDRRTFAQSLTKKTQHRKKPPSRLWRRRPSRLLKRSAREKRKNVWLETHVWHAKRFRMGSIWGYKLPIKSFQRGFRPTFRCSMNLCVSIEHSFLCAIQIQGECAEKIYHQLANFCSSESSPTFARSLYLYEPGAYPFGFLGPAYFSWSITSSITRLQIWLHPAIEEKFLTILCKSGDVKFADENNKGPTNVVKTDASGSSYSGLFVTSLRNRLGRIRVIGPTAFLNLSKILSLVSFENLEKDLKYLPYMESHSYWSENSNKIQPGNLRAGTIISLLVEDPRLFRASPISSSSSLVPVAPDIVSITDPPIPYTDLFWDIELQHKQFQNRISQSDLIKLQSDRIKPVTTTEFKIPIMLVVRRSSSSSLVSTSCNRVDLICPGGITYDFWLALHFANTKAAALRDKLSLDFEAGLICFPSDCPGLFSFYFLPVSCWLKTPIIIKFKKKNKLLDSYAGTSYSKLETASLQKKYLRRPYNRRTNFWSKKIRVEFPFSFEWNKIVQQWNIKSEICLNSSSKNVYVLREKESLLILADFFASKRTDPSKKVLEIIEKYSMALLPVRLENISHGSPKRFALICVPTFEDLQCICGNKKTKILEASQSPANPDCCSSNDSDLKSANDRDIKPTPEYVSLSAGAFGTYFQKFEDQGQLIYLNSMFPQSQNRKRQRNIQKRIKRKESKRMKRQKLEKTDQNLQISSHTPSNIVLNDSKNANDVSSYVESCSKTIIGRVVRGDFSFTHARGLSFGYIPVCSLPSVLVTPKRTLLVRNVSSRVYHPVKTTIHLANCEL